MNEANFLDTKEKENKELDKYATIEEIQALIKGKIMESTPLEYKSSDSLDKTEGKRKEISKDVSAFANSDGGTIIYGVGEQNHIPTGIEWIDNIGRERETLENVILSRIQPKIKNFKIHAVKNPDDDSRGILVVNILQGHTAHMASDNRYYNRRNFRVDPMENYEVIDVMFRRKKPEIDIVLKLQDSEVKWDEKSSGLIKINVFVQNYGNAVARHISGGFEFPDSIVNISRVYLDPDAGHICDYNRGNDVNIKFFDCDSRIKMFGGGYMGGPANMGPLISYPKIKILIEKLSIRIPKNYKSGIIKYWIIAEDMELKEGEFELSIVDNKIHIKKV